MYYLRLVTLLFLSTAFAGCTSAGNSTLLGAGLGAVAGSAIGVASYPGRNGQYQPRNVIVGGALGGLLGAGAGYLVHALFEKKEKEVVDQSKDSDQTPRTTFLPGLGKPTLIPPQVESRFVDDQIRANVFVPAHLEYLIAEPAKWSR